MLNLQISHNQADYALPRVEKGERNLFICPSPKQADVLRKLRYEMGDKQAEVISYSKFLSDGLDQSLTLRSKADLLVDFSFFWKKFSEEKSFQDLNKMRWGFDLFTTLRSYTRNTILFQDLIEPLDEVYQKVFQAFWLYLESSEIIDESRALGLHGEGGHQERRLLFWGFRHLNALQVDHLVRLSQASEVDIQIPHLFWVKKKEGDWVSWLAKSSHLESFQGQSQDDQLKASVFTYRKDHLSESLSTFEKDFDEKKFKSRSFIWCAGHLTLEKALSASRSSGDVKIPAHFFQRVFKYWKKEMRALLPSRREVVSRERLEDFLIEKIEVCLKQKDFNSLGVLNLFRKKIEEIESRSELLKEWDFYWLEILFETAELGLPRVQFVNIHEGRKVLEIEDALSEPPENCVLIWDESLDVRDSAPSLPPDVAKKLVQIGPMRRVDHGALAIKNILRSFLVNSKEVTLFIRDDLKEECSLLELDLEESLRVQVEAHSILNVTRAMVDFSSDLSFLRLSPSKIQNFWDCPKKFYYHYIDGLSTFPQSKIELNHLERGEILHEVIEMSCVNEAFSDEEIKKNLEKSLRSKVKEKGKNLKVEVIRKEVFEMTQILTSFMSRFLPLYKNLTSEGYIPKFERPFRKELGEGFVFSGRADLVFEKEDEIMIFDFKTSFSSIPSKKAVMGGESIQLLSYLANCDDTKKIEACGYISIKSPEKSLIFSSEERRGPFEKELVKKSSPIEELDFKSYKNLEAQILLKIKSSKLQPEPRSKSVCRNCSGKSFCKERRVV